MYGRTETSSVGDGAPLSVGRPFFFLPGSFSLRRCKQKSSSSLRKVESISGGMFGGEHCDKFVPSPSSPFLFIIIFFLFIIIEFIPKTTGDGRTSRITMTGQSRAGIPCTSPFSFHPLHFLFCIASCRLPVHVLVTEKQEIKYKKGE